MPAVVDDYERLVGQDQVRNARAVLSAVERTVWLGEAGEASILVRQLSEVRSAGEKDRRGTREEPPALLLLPVGYSPEPLLLSVAYHAPERVVLLAPLLESDYEVDLSEVWDACRGALGTPPYGELAQRTVRDLAEDVFQTVRAVVEESGLPPERIVLDITGGKKSMIAGAFLAAAHLGVVTAYVDFERYDRVLRRPVPGTLRPGRLRDPARLFQLRRESQLGEALDAGRYEEAEALAGELAEAAAAPEVREVLDRVEAERRQTRFRALGEAAKAYRLWSDGFYADALDAIGARPWLPLPPTVAVLGPKWPGREEKQQAIIESLDEARVFADPMVPLAYFVDVLVWWGPERVRKRPREAYVRLYGTVETLYSFLFHAHAGPGLDRLMIEAADGEGDPLSELDEAAPETSTGAPIDWASELRRGARSAAFDASIQAARLLSRGARSGISALEVLPDLDRLDLRPDSDPGRIRAALLRLRVGFPEAAIPKKLGEGGLWRFRDLRHKAVHWLAPVPPQRAEALRAYLCTLLRETFPAALKRLSAGSPSAALAEWSDRLVRAAEGEIPAECRPLLTRDLDERVSSLAGGTA
jgi:hypothetical protein